MIEAIRNNQPPPLPGDNSGGGRAAPEATVPLAGGSTTTVFRPPESIQPVAKDAPATEPEKESLDQAINKLNQAAEIFKSKISFKIDNNRENMLRIYIMGEGGKMIRAIPPDEVLDLSDRIQSAIGMIFDEKV